MVLDWMSNVWTHRNIKLSVDGTRFSDSLGIELIQVRYVRVRSSGIRLDRIPAVMVTGCRGLHTPLAGAVEDDWLLRGGSIASG